jgi:hypothetical protein
MVAADALERLTALPANEARWALEWAKQDIGAVVRWLGNQPPGLPRNRHSLDFLFGRVALYLGQSYLDRAREFAREVEAHNQQSAAPPWAGFPAPEYTGEW